MVVIDEEVRWAITQKQLKSRVVLLLAGVRSSSVVVPANRIYKIKLRQILARI